MDSDLRLVSRFSFSLRKKKRAREACSRAWISFRQTRPSSLPTTTFSKHAPRTIPQTPSPSCSVLGCGSRSSRRTLSRRNLSSGSIEGHSSEGDRGESIEGEVSFFSCLYLLPDEGSILILILPISLLQSASDDVSFRIKRTARSRFSPSFRLCLPRSWRRWTSKISLISSSSSPNPNPRSLSPRLRPSPWKIPSFRSPQRNPARTLSSFLPPPPPPPPHHQHHQRQHLRRRRRRRAQERKLKLREKERRRERSE